jgi:lipoteichoic acid synthase
MGRTALSIFPGAYPRSFVREPARAWTVVPVGFAAARAVQVLCHFLVPTPYGPRLLETNPGNLPRVAFYGLVAILFIIVAFRVLAHALGRLVGLNGERAALLLLTGFASFYLFFGEMDLELMRWLGQHVSVGWLRAYSWKPDAVKLRLLHSDVLATSLAIVLATVPPLVLLGYAAARRPVTRLRWTTTGLLAIPMLAGIGISLPDVRKPAEFRPVQPPLFTFWDEAVRAFGVRISPEQLARGTALIHTALARSESEFPVVRYPLWHEVSDEEAGFERFRELPIEQKPDVFVVLLESAEGWEFDLRRPEVQERYPSLTALYKERGVFFPYTHSVGFPSPEGRVGVHLGLWSHPTDRIIEQYRSIRLLSLPEILARAGYRTSLVAAGDPNFDHMEPWYDKWYQHWFFDPQKTDDFSAAGEVLDVASRLRADRPRFVLFNTVPMHAPYTFPGCSKNPDLTFHDRYLEASRYADAALGRLFDGLRKTRRWSRTIVVVVGDHSITGPWIGFQAPRAGTPNTAETWIPLLVAGPGLRGGEARTELASQLDVPPTVLSMIGLQASNHFLGRDLMSPSAAPPMGVFSFRNGGIAATLGPVRYQFELTDTRFFRKTRYGDLDSQCADPEPAGCYRSGTALPMTPQDADLMKDLRLMARAYGELFRKDRIMPPAAVLPYPRAANARSVAPRG